MTLLDGDANEGVSRWIAQAVPKVHVERARTSAELLKAIPLLRADCEVIARRRLRRRNRSGSFP